MRCLPGFAAGMYALVAIAAAGPADAQPTLVVRPVTTGSLTVEPGKIASAVFRVTNTGLAPRTIRGDVQLPGGWRIAVGDDAPYGLASGAAESRVVAFAVPANAAAGVYHVRYVARAAGTTSEAGDSVRVLVPPRRHVLLTRIQAPSAVRAGERYVATFLVTNTGNVSDRLILRVRCTYGFSCTTDPSTLELAPGSAREVRVSVATVTTPGTAYRKITHRVDLIASSAADTAATSAAAAVVDVMPPPERPVARYESIPAVVALRGASSSDGAVTRSAELRGAGTLGDGTTHVAILLRGPAATQGLLAEHDQYSASVRTPHLALQLGDQTFRLTSLTESGRNGFGVGGAVSAWRLGAGAFVQRQRWISAPFATSERAAFVELRPTTRSALSVNHLDRTGPDAGSISTVHATAAVARTEIEGEYGVGSASAMSGSPAGAGRAIRVSSDISRLRFNGEHRRTDLAFPMPGGERAYDHAALGLAIWRRLVLSGDALRYRTGWADTSTVPLIVPGPRRTFGALGEERRALAGRVGYGDAIIEYRVSSRAPAGGVPLPATRDAGVRVGAGADIGPLRLRPELQIGTITDTRTGGRYPSRRARVQASTHGTGIANVAAYFEAFDGSSIYALARQRGTGGGVTGIVTAGSRSRLLVTAQATRYELPYRMTSGIIDGRFEQTLMLGHQLAIRGRLRLLGPGGRFAERALQLQYSIPLGIPVRAARNTAAVDARVVDVATGQPLANTVVRLGDRQLTSDRDGRIRARGLAPRRYDVDVEPGSIGAGYVLDDATDTLVDAVRGRTSTLRIGVVRGASLDGSIEIGREAVVVGGSAVGTADGADSLGTIVVELTRGADTLRRVVGGDRRFSVTDLRPGIWSVRVAAARLAARWRFEHDSMVVALEPGARSTVTLRVVPRERSVRIVGGGTLVLGAAEPTPDDRRSAAEPAPASPRRPGIRHTYTVTRWDLGLPSIAGFVYGDRTLWPKIWLANRDLLRTPRGVRDGQRLAIPDSAPLTAEEIRARDEYLARTPGAGALNRPVIVHWYTVTRWDVGLADIAGKVYGDSSLWPKIWLANRAKLDAPNKLRRGQRLRIPERAPLTPAEIAARDAIGAR